MIKAKESLGAMFAEGRHATTTKNGAVILKSGARYHQLVNRAGVKTKLGNHYEEQTGNPVLDPTQLTLDDFWFCPLRPLVLIPKT